jgi:TolB-like protein/Tfp pilus assembly protein PilF
MSFVEELKQRKVFKVAAAYVVAGWVAVQVASIALPAFEAPAWAMRAFILAILLGFPVALLVSWAFDRTEHGIELTPGRRFNLRLLALCAGLAMLSVGWFLLGRTAGEDANASSATSTAASEAQQVERSIAVLPFRNLGGDESTAYFSDGLAETSLDMLARVPELKVIARSSSFTFRDAALDVAEAGRKLGVAHLLQGSVQTAGERMRITVQLVRAADAAQLWSGRYDRELTDVFAIQDEIAREVVRAIEVALPEGGTAALNAGGTRNVAAYEAYLKGNQLLWTRQVADMRQAQAHFEQAKALDPSYLQAETMAVLAELLIGANTGTLERDDARRYREAYDAILAREPRLAEAYIARGNARSRLDDPEGALSDYDAGLAISPNLAVGHQWRAELLFFELERVADAVAAHRRAIELDPITPQIRIAYARSLVAQNRDAEALALLREVRIAYADNLNAAADVSLLGLQTGDIAASFRTLAEAKRAGADGYRLDMLACQTLAIIGADADATRCIDVLAASSGDPTGNLAVMRLINAAIAGRIDEARRYWEAMVPDARPYDPLLLVTLGQETEALAMIREGRPGLFENPPRLRRLDVSTYTLAASLLARQGKSEEAEALLRAGLARFADSPRNGEWGTGWSEGIAHALLGDTAAACRSIAAAQEQGRVDFFAELQATPGLDALRADPCFAPLLAAHRERVERAMAPLRTERLWPGAE